MAGGFINGETHGANQTTLAVNLSKLLPDGASDLDLMTDSPTQVDFKQLRELYIQTTAKEKRESPAPAAQ